MLVSDETRRYRVFPWHAGRYGYPLVVTGMTKEATVPGRIARWRAAGDGQRRYQDGSGLGRSVRRRRLARYQLHHPG